MPKIDRDKHQTELNRQVPLSNAAITFKPISDIGTVYMHEPTVLTNFLLFL